MKFMDDYKKVVEAEGKKEFSFVPDTMAMTPGEAKGVPERDRKRMKLMHRLAGPAIAVVFVLLFAAFRGFKPVAILAGCMIVLVSYAFLIVYKNLR